MSNSETFDACLAMVRASCRLTPRVAIILGSGLGGLSERIETETVFAYSELPGFGHASASGHRGELIFGRLEGIEVVAMAGRFHRYEGWSLQQITFPVRLMHSLGAQILIVSNAAGGVNPKLRVGDILVIRDHINWIGEAHLPSTHLPSTHLPSTHLPSTAVENRTAAEHLLGRHGLLGRKGQIYDDQLSRLALEIAVKHQFDAHQGTYLATLGPNYETRSEYRMMRRMGVDVVGMSTVPEVLTAADLQMPTLGLSMVSNVANPDRPIKADHAEVLEAGRAAETKMEAIVRGVLRGTEPSHIDV